ncbi:MAG: polysaccharide biosynthesis/export family protein [Flavobacteriia bacterium]|nr:polysaccharide biosynthesis/export family protein [Flavobacteriia bacterium]
MINNKFYKLIFLSPLLIVLGSCGINSSIMFKTPKGGSFKYDSIPMRPATEYTISKDDKFNFYLYPNAGEKLIESISGTNVKEDNILFGNNNNNIFTNFQYIVKGDGNVELPIVGNVKAEGLTLSEFQDSLKKKYATQYNTPFIKVEITNQRCIVFSGQGSAAKIVPIMNNNTTLMEIIAQAGGIDSRGQSKIIKLMRRVNGSREVYLIDLSTMEGLVYTDMIVQGNDYIYIEPKPDLAKELVKEIAPVLSIISSVFVIVRIIQTTK